MWIQSYRYSGSSCLVRAGVWSTFGGGGMIAMFEYFCITRYMVIIIQWNHMHLNTQVYNMHLL